MNKEKKPLWNAKSHKLCKKNRVRKFANGLQTVCKHTVCILFANCLQTVCKFSKQKYPLKSKDFFAKIKQFNELNNVKNT